MAILPALLTLSVVISIGVGANADTFRDRCLPSWVEIAGSIGLLWAVWGVMFYKYWSRHFDAHRAGGVMAVKVKGKHDGTADRSSLCHIIVRRRNDCSAPIATSFGITTRIAVMLLSFGPSVLILYRKRLDSYPNHHAWSGPRPIPITGSHSE